MNRLVIGSAKPEIYDIYICINCHNNIDTFTSSILSAVLLKQVNFNKFYNK